MRNNTPVSRRSFRISLSLVVILAALAGCVGEISGADPDGAELAQTACLPPPPPELTVENGSVLLVVGDTSLSEGDQAVSDRLRTLGFSVTTRKAKQTQAADATGRDLVVVSSTSNSQDLGDRLRNVAVPLVTWESALFDDLRMTGASDGADYGGVASEDDIDVVDAAHPIAQSAHLVEGKLDVSADAGEMRWGKPGAAAKTIARMRGSSSRAAVFAYDAGAALVGGGTAAERRVGLYYADESARRFTDAGWRLFDAAMLWSAGLPTQRAPIGDVLFVVGSKQLTAADAAIRSRLVGMGLTVALRDDDVLHAEDATDRKLVVVSESVDSNTVGMRLRDVTVPLVSFEEGLFDALRLTGTNEGPDFGSIDHQATIDVVAPTHPIAVGAGLAAGTVKIVYSKDTFHYGRPGSAAQVVATVTGQSTRATVFTYAKGAALVGGGTAAARRVGAFLSDRTATRLNDAGLRLFDAIIRWALDVAAPTPAGDALLVVGCDSPLSTSDVAVRDRLAGLGFTVSVRTGDAVKAADATGKRVAVIASSTTSADVGADLRDVKVPVITWEPNLFDDMRFTGATENTNFGTVGNQSKINVVMAAHPIAVDAGLAPGPVTVVTSADDFRWGKPAAGALIVATLDGQAARTALFTFEQGAALTSGTAAARRVGMFFGDDIGVHWNATGIRIFDASVRWAIATPGPVCVPTTETCNGKDDDCDGVIDDGVTTTFYRDQDGDGFGVTTTTAQACSAPAGFVAVAGDCDDANPARRPNAPELCNDIDDNCSGAADEGLATSTFYRDQDADGFGNMSVTKVDCAAPAGFIAQAGDCDDSKAAVHPGATEVCNGIDDNCAGGVDEGVKTTFFRDLDADGYGTTTPTQAACVKPAGYASIAGDCDDSKAAVHPGAPEVCNDVDDNCVGGADEGLATSTFFRDQDADNYGVTSNTKVDCALPAGYATVAGDCNDSKAAIHPNAPEKCNGVDDNCAGGVDESPVDGQTFYQDNDTDGFGKIGGAVVACTAPTTGGEWVNTTGDCNDNDDDVHPGATEVCNGIDDNCNSKKDTDTTWYLDADADGVGGGTVFAMGCPGPNPNTPPAVSLESGDCDDTNHDVHPGADEVCNGEDDDCDSFVDEDAVDEEQFYLDGDNDGYGNPNMPVDACFAPTGYVPNDDDCDDTRATVSPGDPEVPGNGLDDDCDGVKDESP